MKRASISLFLASTSSYRHSLLKRLDRPFQALAPQGNEQQWKEDLKHLNPRELAQKLAYKKAQSLIHHPEVTSKSRALVIGSDQIIFLGSQSFSKPLSIEKAEEDLAHLQGKVHELYTAVSLIECREGKILGENVFGVFAKMEMRRLDLEQIRNYVQKDRPLDCAGSYKLESFGIKLFSAIECTDFSTIEGLPLIQLENELLKYDMEG